MALKHPTRSYALNLCTQRPTSPKEVAGDLRLDVSAVYYHFDRLVKLGCIEEVSTQKRRGATEHFYRATVKHFFDAETWKNVPEESRMKITLDIVGSTSEDLSRAAQAGTLDKDDNHISRTLLKLDEQGWAETVARLAEALEDVMTIKERSALRLLESDETPIDTSVSILHVETPAL